MPEPKSRTSGRWRGSPCAAARWTSYSDCRASDCPYLGVRRLKCGGERCRAIIPRRKGSQRTRSPAESSGPRGVPGGEDSAKMTPQQEKNLPKEGEFDGHVASFDGRRRVDASVSFWRLSRRWISAWRILSC